MHRLRPWYRRQIDQRRHWYSSRWHRGIHIFPDIYIGCNDTGIKVATSVNEAGSKFAADVNDVGGRTLLLPTTLTVINYYNIGFPTPIEL